MVDMARTEAPIDWNKVDELLEAGCPGTEVAACLGIHANTLYDRIEKKYNCNYRDYLYQKRAKGDHLIRQQQYNKALGLTDKGDNTLLIWLGKCRLKQTENHQSEENQQKMFGINYAKSNDNPVEILPSSVPITDPECA